ncbi:unnamed protein product, partial [Litomosoides sigmodontis]
MSDVASGVEIEKNRDILHKMFNIANEQNQLRCRSLNLQLVMRDSLAQLLYEQLIDWILQRINAATTNGCKLNSKNSNATIVLADCYGFERSTSVNGFEQFCVNFYNERLEWYYQQKVFRELQWEYQTDNITGIDMQ